MITIKDVEHVAKLARLELIEEEKEKFSKQLDAILKHMDQLNEVDTTGVEPMAHAFAIKNVMREDKIVQEFSRDEMLVNAPDEEDGFFKVPKISD
jgi:aspartyl-tRNA(Asn)/glutamyl-tRNA(Gln) amidotransferase subunit C